MTLSQECWVAVEMQAEAAFRSRNPERALERLRAKDFVRANPKIAEAIIAAVRDDVVKGLKEPEQVYA